MTPRETSRLILTTPAPADAAEIFERYASDPEVTRFMAWPRHRSIADTQDFLAFSAAEWARWPAGPLLIRARADGRLVGSTGFAFSHPTEAMTGYVLARDAWGQGLATEALGAVVDLARDLKVARLYAPFHPDNHASRRVLEKCGFTRDARYATTHEFPNLTPGVLLNVESYELVLNAVGNHGPK